MYYQGYDFQKRFSFLWAAGLVAGAFGELLAFALYHMHGLGGYSGWRWIFIIEGLLSIVFAILAKFIIADWPEHAKFLSEDEKQLLRERNSRDDGEEREWIDSMVPRGNGSCLTGSSMSTV